MNRQTQETIAKAIFDKVIELAPEEGSTFSLQAVAIDLGFEVEDMSFKLAWDSARMELIEATPSYLFKPVVGTGGTYMRLFEHERADKWGMRKLRKARGQAKEALRGLVRTNRSKLSQDQVKHLDARTVQASNAYFDVKDAIKRADPKRGARWLTQVEVDPGPRPNFASPKPSPPKPQQQRWFHDGPPSSEPS